jgi:hypothetical protein
MSQGRSLTEQEIEKKIEICKKIHNNKYSYDKLKYVNYETKVIITCPIHGDFYQNFRDHTIGQGCRKCAFLKIKKDFTKGKEDFILECNKIFNNKYTYNKVPDEFKLKDKVTITCPIHGDFIKIAFSHKRGVGCLRCKGIGNEHIFNRLSQRKNLKLITPKDQIRFKKNIEFECEFHGKISRNKQQIRRFGICVKCENKDKEKQKSEDVIKNLNKKFSKPIGIESLKNKFKSKFEYINPPSKITSDTILNIRCKEHNHTFQIRKENHHYSKYGGCEFCLKEKSKTLKLTTEKVLEKFNLVHGDRYLYDKVMYESNQKKVIITCRKHGDFPQLVSSHAKGTGCPSCSISQGERMLHKILTEMKLNFISQKIFYGCKNPETDRHLLFDIYVPEYHTCIEYDGVQHFESSHLWGGDTNLEKIKFRDEIKNNYCKTNEIDLIRIPYTMDWEDIVKLLNEKFNKNLKIEIRRRNKWFENNIMDIVKNYETKSEFLEKNPVLYTYCQRNKILKKVCSHMVPFRNEKKNLEDLIFITKKYDNYSVFYKEQKGITDYINKHNLDYLTNHMFRDRIIRTDEEIIEELKKYEYKMDLRHQDPNLYSVVLRKGLTNLLKNKFKRWDDEKVIEAFKNSKSKKDLQKRFRGAENYAIKNGLYDNFVELYLNKNGK